MERKSVKIAPTGNVDKSTYAGQFAKRRQNKKMDANNKQRLRALHLQLGNLLTQKKALNSKVTTRHFELFREAVESNADPYDIKSRLTRLEQSLKQEGLYKNVKSDFVHLRKDILGSLNWSESSNPSHQHKSKLPGISSIAKDRTFYVAPKASQDDNPAPVGQSPTKQGAAPLSTDDMRMLNSAIGKLYRHLQLNQEMTSMDMTFKETSKQKENINILTLSNLNPDESFHEIVLKLKTFEQEFQRQKVQQQRELMRLQEEIKRLNKNSVELRRENERMKGVQPIMSKAKGKQVASIEERHRTEKKGMEEKINELETGMKRNFAQIIQDREEVKSHIRADVDNLTSSINNLHHLVLGYHHETNTVHSKSADDTELLPTKYLLNTLKTVTDGVQTMKGKMKETNSQLEELKSWRRSLKDLDTEISYFSMEFADDYDDDDNNSSGIFSHRSDPITIVGVCKSKLQKTKENIKEKLKYIGEESSEMRSSERKSSRDLTELKNEITKLHDEVVSVQIQDISISMPDFDRRHNESDGSTDDLPEADRQEQHTLLDKLKQIGTLVKHFQQLIIDRTGILNKMENDMLPLKIRVNRLYEEVSKAMTSSPEHDPADDMFKPRRSVSPEATSNTISREISNMLRKLSKMEMTIRHLLERHADDHR